MKKKQEEQKMKQYIKEVMQKTLQQLQLQKIQKDMNILFQLQQLQYKSKQLQNGGYMNVVGRLGLENTRVNQISQQNLQKLLKSLDRYIDLLRVNNEYQTSTLSHTKNPKQLKSRPQINMSLIKQQPTKCQKQYSIKQQKDLMEIKRYFIFFHDLECQRKIEFSPDSYQAQQTIQQSVDIVRDQLYDEPQRPLFTTVHNKIERDLNKLEEIYQQVQYQQHYVINRKINQNEMQVMLNDVDDLKIEYELEDMPDDQENQQLIKLLEQPQQSQLQTQMNIQQIQSQSQIQQSIAMAESNVGSQQGDLKIYQQNLLSYQILQQAKKSQSNKQKQINTKSIQLPYGKQIKIEKSQQQSYEVEQTQTVTQKSLILEHLSKLQDQLSQSLSQQSLILMNFNDSYMQMNLDEILEPNQKHQTINKNDTN